MTDPSKKPETTEAENNQQKVFPNDLQNEGESGVVQEEESRKRFILKPTDRFYFNLGK